MSESIAEAQLRRLYRVICLGESRTEDFRGIAQAIIDEHLEVLASHETLMTQVVARGNKLSEAAHHISRAHDVVCDGSPCTCGLDALLEALSEWSSPS